MGLDDEPSLAHARAAAAWLGAAFEVMLQESGTQSRFIWEKLMIAGETELSMALSTIRDDGMRLNTHTHARECDATASRVETNLPQW